MTQIASNIGRVIGMLLKMKGDFLKSTTHWSGQLGTDEGTSLVLSQTLHGFAACGADMALLNT